MDGSARSPTAIADDFALEKGVELCERLSQVVPAALFTIENPVNDVWPCDWDCNYLLPSCNQHRIALCKDKNNHPDQVVISDPFQKGRIPRGLFERTFKAYCD